MALTRDANPDGETIAAGNLVEGLKGDGNA
jgi:hypothetical protein